MPFIPESVAGFAHCCADNDKYNEGSSFALFHSISGRNVVL